MNYLILLSIIFAPSLARDKIPPMVQIQAAFANTRSMFSGIACKMQDAGHPIYWLPEDFLQDEISTNYNAKKHCKKENFVEENKQLLGCVFCLKYYRNVNFRRRINFDGIEENCKQIGCDRFEQKVTNGNALRKFLENEEKITEYCEKHKNYNYCRETEDGQCNQYDLETKSYTETRDFKTGDIVVVFDLPKHLNSENVFKKRIHKSKTKFYKSCSFHSCFNEPENGKDFCKYHDNSPFVTKEEIFQKIRLKVATMKEKWFLLSAILKYENSLNSLTAELGADFFTRYNQPSWWPKSIEFAMHSTYKSANLNELIALAYKHYGKYSNVEDPVELTPNLDNNSFGSEIDCLNKTFESCLKPGQFICEINNSRGKRQAEQSNENEVSCNCGPSKESSKCSIHNNGKNEDEKLAGQRRASFKRTQEKMKCTEDENKENKKFKCEIVKPKTAVPMPILGERDLNEGDQVNKREFTIAFMEGDGNCGPRALAHLLLKNQKDHAEIRSRIVEEMKKEDTDCHYFAVENELNKAVDEYIDYISKDRQWIGEPEFKCAASIYKKCIYQMYEDNKEDVYNYAVNAIFGDPYDCEDKDKIYIKATRAHYDALEWIPLLSPPEEDMDVSFGSHTCTDVDTDVDTIIDTDVDTDSDTIIDSDTPQSLLDPPEQTNGLEENIKNYLNINDDPVEWREEDQKELIDVYKKFRSESTSQVCIKERKLEEELKSVQDELDDCTKGFKLNYLIHVNGHWYIGEGHPDRPMEHFVESYFCLKLIEDKIDIKHSKKQSESRKIETLTAYLREDKKEIELFKFNQGSSKCLVQVVEAALIDLFNVDKKIEFGQGLLNSKKEMVDLFGGEEKLKSEKQTLKKLAFKKFLASKASKENFDKKKLEKTYEKEYSDKDDGFKNYLKKYIGEKTETTYPKIANLYYYFKYGIETDPFNRWIKYRLIQFVNNKYACGEKKDRRLPPYTWINLAAIYNMYRKEGTEETTNKKLTSFYGFNGHFKKKIEEIVKNKKGITKNLEKDIEKTLKVTDFESGLSRAVVYFTLQLYCKMLTKAGFKRGGKNSYYYRSITERLDELKEKFKGNNGFNYNFNYGKIEKNKGIEILQNFFRSGIHTLIIYDTCPPSIKLKQIEENIYFQEELIKSYRENKKTEIDAYLKEVKNFVFSHKIIGVFPKGKDKEKLVADPLVKDTTYPNENNGNKKFYKCKFNTMNEYFLRNFRVTKPVLKFNKDTWKTDGYLFNGIPNLRPTNKRRDDVPDEYKETYDDVMKNSPAKSMEMIFKEDFGVNCFNERFTDNSNLAKFITGVFKSEVVKGGDMSISLGSKDNIQYNFGPHIFNLERIIN